MDDPRTIGSYRNRKGEKISLKEWADLYDDKNYRELAFDIIDDDEGIREIYTYWTGTSVSANEAINIFESRVSYNSNILFYVPSHTENEARKVHAKLIEDAKNILTSAMCLEIIRQSKEDCRNISIF